MNLFQLIYFVRQLLLLVSTFGLGAAAGILFAKLSLA